MLHFEALQDDVESQTQARAREIVETGGSGRERRWWSKVMPHVVTTIVSVIAVLCLLAIIGAASVTTTTTSTTSTVTTSTVTTSTTTTTTCPPIMFGTDYVPNYGTKGNIPFFNVGNDNYFSPFGNFKWSGCSTTTTTRRPFG